MSKPLPIDFDRLTALRLEHGTISAARMARREAITKELATETPDFAAVIMTLLELI